MKAKCVVWLLTLAVVCSACNTTRQVLGIVGPGEPTIDLKSAETRWLLIKNPRFGDVRSEPEYIWVEEDKVPTTFSTLIHGKASVIAPPEVVAKYGPPPGGGKISTRQGVAYPGQDAPKPTTAAIVDPRTSGSASPPPSTLTRTAAGAAPPVAAAPAPKKGLVVFVDTTRLVTDLTAVDGMRPGTLVSVRRDKIPIVHPITGEVLGELDEEVATARVTDVRDRFSVAEIQSVTAGAQVQVKDRVVPK
jgi:hypothetical protein